MPSIAPTVGRIVLFYPPVTAQNGQGKPMRAEKGQPFPAIITHVNLDGTVSLHPFDDSVYGHLPPYGVVPIIDAPPEGQPGPNGRYATWMPYQVGQAAKTEQLQAQVDSRNPTSGSAPGSTVNVRRAFAWLPIILALLAGVIGTAVLVPAVTPTGAPPVQGPSAAQLSASQAPVPAPTLSPAPAPVPAPLDATTLPTWDLLTALATKSLGPAAGAAITLVGPPLFKRLTTKPAPTAPKV